MILFFRYFIAVIALSVTVSGPAAAQERLRILTMGDSMLAAHRMSKRAVSNVLAHTLKASVTDRSVIGARVIYKLPITGAMGMNISKQFRGNEWDYVVLNGGGNDLLFGCGCNVCTRKLNRLISADGKQGEIPNMIRKVRETGARVIYVGYLRSPGVGSPVESCKDEGDELERRITAFAATDDGVDFLSLADLVPHGDRSFHGVDMIHPSTKGSWAIGLRVAELMRR